MFRQILVPVDFSDANDAAVKHAVDLVTQSGGAVSLLHVIELIAGENDDEFKDFYAFLDDKATREMDELKSRIDIDGVEHHEVIVFGNRASAILDHAEENDVDLIVMSSRRLNPYHPHDIASMSHKVAILASCPVLLVKG